MRFAAWLKDFRGECESAVGRNAGRCIASLAMRYSLSFGVSRSRST